MPEFSYFTNSYKAGTPVFSLSPENLKKEGCQVKPFSTAVETPYVLLDRPRVLIIGAGGGRDLFMAGVHDATDVVAAEINPATYQAMAPGGIAYEYSGRIYTNRGTKVHNIDGRHLIKNQPPESRDLIVLNGIDTFAALATGAFAFAENYLYTQDAIVDYLKVLKPGGIINFNRWFEGKERPRETLRLFLMSMDALRSLGVKDPTKHVIIGHVDGWGIMLIKRTPFEAAEERKVLDYFPEHRIHAFYTPRWKKRPEELNPLDLAAEAFFVVLFIFVPLLVFRQKGEPLFPSGLKIPFVSYFAALGLGFIFIEITLMQRFTLALGSPIYSVSVGLATILIASGAGSQLSGRFRSWAGTDERLIQILGILVALYLVGMVGGGTPLLNSLVPCSFPVRVALSALLLAPVAVCLGVFFPTGLLLIGERSSQAVAWAWGINSGFTVLGSIVTILIAQFLGFNTVLLLAAALYLLAPLAYRWMNRGLHPSG